ncbi:MAG: hypothetical protein J5I65_16725 [Aridibacter famidurans]|nr:hypothetical protein [Aridibacter famidurans]
MIFETACPVCPAEVPQPALVLLLLPSLVPAVFIPPLVVETSLLAAIVDLISASLAVVARIPVRTAVVPFPLPTVVVPAITSIALCLLLLLTAPQLGLPLQFLSPALIAELLRPPLIRTVPLRLLPLSLVAKLFGAPLRLAISLDLLALDRPLLGLATLVFPCPLGLSLLFAALLGLSVLDLLSLPCPVLLRAIRILVLAPDLPALLGAVLFRTLLLSALFCLLTVAVLTAAILLPESKVGRSQEQKKADNGKSRSFLGKSKCHCFSLKCWLKKPGIYRLKVQSPFLGRFEGIWRVL